MNANVLDFFISDYQPGALGRVCEMQARYYTRAWGFGSAFEIKVAGEMAGFMARFDPSRDMFKIACGENRIAGSITIDGSETGDDRAHLRWFIVDDESRGCGVGRRLLDLAVIFAESRGFRLVYLWSFEGLAQARYLYESAGFELTEARRGSGWGAEVTEQMFELRLRE